MVGLSFDQGNFHIDFRSLFLFVNIFILRHGEAGRRLSVPSKDYERTLTETGREEIESTSKSIQRLDLEFDIIISSPLKRCHDTATIIAKGQDNKVKVEDWDELEPEGSRTELFHRISRLKQDSNVMLVGHDPYLSILIGEVISGIPTVQLSLKKGGLAKIRMTTFSPKATGELRWLLSPKLLLKVK